MHADEEMTEALQDLARLAWRGVPGCEGASISLLRDDAPNSMAASSAQVRAVDEAQYTAGTDPTSVLCGTPGR